MATREIKTKFSLDGEKEWKQEMSAINSNLKTLKSEMAASESTFKGQANSIQALTAKNKLLHESYDQQKEKVEAMKAALAEAEVVYADSPEKIDKYKQQLNYATVELNKMDDELQENEKYLAEAAASSDGTAHSIDEFGKEVDETKEKTSTFGEVLKANLTSEAIVNGVKAMVGAIKEIGGAIKDTVVDTAKWADDLATLSVKTGISTEKLQEYQYMAELTDTSVDTITGSMAKLTKNMETAKGGTGAAAEAFEALGISVTSPIGTLRSNEEVFGEVIDALGKMQNETQRDAYAMEIFGKSAQDLNPLIATGSEGIAAFAQEAHDMGYVMEEDSINALVETSDAMERMKNALTAAKNDLGADFAPGMTEIFDGVTAVLSGDVEGGLALIESGMAYFGEILQRIGPTVQDALNLLLDTVIQNLPSVIDSGTELIVSLILGIVKAMPQLVPKTVELVMQIVTTLLDNTDLIIEAGIQLVVGLAVGLIKEIPNLVSKLPQILTAIDKGLRAGISQIANIGMDLIRGLWNGISDMAGWIKSKIQGFGQGVLSALKSFFGIRSPSTVMRDQVGRYLAEGVTEGFVDNIDADAMAEAIPSSFDIAASVNGGTNAILGSSSQTLQVQMMTVNAGLLEEIRAIKAEIEGLKKMGLYLDSGRLVGGIAPQMNQALGQIQASAARGY